MHIRTIQITDLNTWVSQMNRAYRASTVHPDHRSWTDDAKLHAPIFDPEQM